MNYETKTDKDQWARRSARMQCSTCMWWRWTTEGETFGYCGKAGKP